MITTGQLAAFRSVWSVLAEEGKCDAIDGCEYERVLREWCQAGCPERMADFIVYAANVCVDMNDRPYGRWQWN